MKPASDCSRLVDDLMSKVLDSTLDDREQEMLTDLLRRDPQVRRLYHDHIALHALLHWKEPNILEEAGSDRILGVEYSAYSAADHLTPTPVPALSFLGSAYHGTANFFSQEIPFACLMATLFMISGGIIGSLITKEHYMQMPGRSVASAERSYADANAADKANAAAKEEEKVPWVGRITGMVDCKWSADEGFYPPSSYDVVLGRKYKLESGLMEITYNTGAKVILQGPVTYEVESANGGYMSLGKLTGKVEVEKAKGFIVRTPTAVVTDLGTEFGVEVNDTGETRTCVFVGVVEMASLSGGGQVRLGADQSARAASGQAPEIILVQNDVHKPSFTRKLSALPEPDRDNVGDYAKAVLADKPIGYWRFEENTSSVGAEAADASGRGHAGLYAGGVGLGRGVPGIGGRAAAFNGTTAHVFIPNHADFETNELSVEFWLRTSQEWWLKWKDAWPGNAVLIDKGTPLPCSGDWSIIGGGDAQGNHNRLIVGIGSSPLRPTADWPDGRDTEVASSGKLNDGQWHHIVWTRSSDGRNVLYVDGVISADVPDGGRTIANRQDIYFGGLPALAEAQHAFFRGYMDEVALYGHVLDAARVADHYRLAAGDTASVTKQGNKSENKN